MHALFRQVAHFEVYNLHVCFGVFASGHELKPSGLRCLTNPWLLTVVDCIHSPCGQSSAVTHRKSKDSHESASSNLEYSRNRPEFWETGALKENLKITFASASGHLKLCSSVSSTERP